MKKVLGVFLAMFVCAPSASASVKDEIQNVLQQGVWITSGAVVFIDNGCHWLWDNVHGKLIHPMAAALADGLEAATFGTIDVDGDGIETGEELNNEAQPVN